MFLRGIKFRLIFWFTTTIFFSVSIACGTLFYLLADSLRKSDRKLIESKSIAIQKILSKDDFQNELLEYTYKDENLYVTVLRSDLTPKFTHLPEDVDDRDELNVIVNKSRKDIKKGWKIFLLESGIANPDFDTKVQTLLMKIGLKRTVYLLEDDIFESYTVALSSGGFLTVGASAEKREEKLTHIRSIAYMLIFIFPIVSIALALFLAKRLLRPIHEIINTIDDIEKGGIGPRVSVTGSHDEIDQLAVRFNGLLNHNEKLIENLKGTLDNVAHDLKTPMTRLINAAEEAINSDLDHEKLKGALSNSIENGTKIISLLDAIMDLTEAETGTMSLKLEEFYLYELLEQAVELYEYASEDRHIKMSLSGNKDVIVKADRIRIAQALTNLIDNAFKYSGDHSQIDLSLSTENKMALVSVKDQGKGIAENEQSKIWERMYRVDQSRTTTGMGIGLSVVRAVAKAHSGNVSVVSELEKGSTFTLKIPFLC